MKTAGSVFTVSEEMSVNVGWNITMLCSECLRKLFTCGPCVFSRLKRAPFYWQNMCSPSSPFSQFPIKNNLHLGTWLFHCLCRVPLEVFFFFWRGMRDDFFHAAFSHLYWNSLWWVLEHRPRSWQLPSIWPDLLTTADEAQSKSLLSENGINLWTYLGSNYIQPHFFLNSYPPTSESKL